MGEREHAAFALCRSPWHKFSEQFALEVVGFGAGSSSSCLPGCPEVANLALRFPAASLTVAPLCIL